MSSNALGTIFRIGLISLGLFCVWFFSIGFIYMIFSFILGFEFSFSIWILLFMGVMIFRMFYPKNVFI